MTVFLDLLASILQLIHAPLEAVDLFYADSKNMVLTAFVEPLAMIWLIIFAAMTFSITLKIPLLRASLHRLVLLQLLLLPLLHRPLHLLLPLQLLLLPMRPAELADRLLALQENLAAMILVLDLLASTPQLSRALWEVVDLFFADSKNMVQMELAELLAMIWLISLAAMTSYLE